MNKSADSEEESSLAGATHLRSSSQDKESSVDDLLAGHVKEDPVLYGVSQMLSILKQHVTKPKVKYVKVKYCGRICNIHTTHAFMYYAATPRRAYRDKHIYNALVDMCIC